MKLITRNKILLFSAAVFILLSAGCSSGIGRSPELNISVKAKSIYAWIDLMPGKASSFHIKGDLVVENKEAVRLRDLRISSVNIVQSGDTVFRFVPQFKAAAEENNGLESGVSKAFTFRNIKGIVLRKKFDFSMKAVAVMRFAAEGRSLVYKSSEFKIEKVY